MCGKYVCVECLLLLNSPNIYSLQCERTLRERDMIVWHRHQIKLKTLIYLFTYPITPNHHVSTLFANIDRGCWTCLVVWISLSNSWGQQKGVPVTSSDLRSYSFPSVPPPAAACSSSCLSGLAAWWSGLGVWPPPCEKPSQGGCQQNQRCGPKDRLRREDGCWHHPKWPNHNDWFPWWLRALRRGSSRLDYPPFFQNHLFLVSTNRNVS